MTKTNDVKKMSKKDLLQLLVMQSKKIDELEEELTQANKLLESKQIMISEAGSIAEASLKLNKIFELAQEAADQYLENIKQLNEKKKEKLETSKNKQKSTKVKKNKKIKKVKC